MDHIGAPVIPLPDAWLASAKQLCAAATAPLTPHSQLCKERNEDFTEHRLVREVEFVHSPMRGLVNDPDAWVVVDLDKYLPEPLPEETLPLPLPPPPPLPLPLTLPLHLPLPLPEVLSPGSCSTVKKQKTTHHKQKSTYDGAPKRGLFVEQVFTEHITPTHTHIHTHTRML